VRQPSCRTLAQRDALRGKTRSSELGTAKWSLTLICSFLALGPCAILGNSFFSKPIFTDGEATLGAPSLWVWQIVFWLLGVLLVWWLAYRARMSIIENVAWRRIDLDPPRGQLERGRAPPWIALLLARVAKRLTQVANDAVDTLQMLARLADQEPTLLARLGASG
jgi:solute:Na+ symporter, SSS family